MSEALATAATSAVPARFTAKASRMTSTAQDFEAVFIGQLVGLMMEQLPTDGPFGGGNAEATFRGLMSEEMGKAIAKRGGIGLAPSVMDQMIRMQNASLPPLPSATASMTEPEPLP